MFSPFRLPDLLHNCHAALAHVVHAGDMVLDATAGNGYDTLHLAQLVGPTGLVLAFDVQACALDAVSARLCAAEQAVQVRCIHAGHEQAHRHVQEYLKGSPWQGLKALVFNLGFLPGSNKEIATCADTSLVACQSLLPYIVPGGLLALHCYTGHAGGLAEAQSLEHWAAQLPWKHWRVLCTSQHNKPKNRESLLLIQREPERPHRQCL